MKKRINMLLAVCLLLGLTACKETAPEEAVITVAPTIPQTTAAAPETTGQPAEPAGPVLLERPENGKVCVGFMPTEAGAWRYVVIEDQEAAAAAYERAVASIYSDEWWIKGDRTQGLMVVYDEIWEFVESGELVYALGRVNAEDAAQLYALCAGAAKEMGWKEPVHPEQLADIACATLRQGTVSIPLTDPAALDQLETMLSGATYALGGTGCPFTAMLDVQLASGELLTIALATDSCGVWMSEGYYYEFSGDSQPLYDLFGITLEFGKIKE